MYDKANVPSSLAKISMCGNTELIMSYCTLDMTDSVYYIQDYDAVIIANFVEDTIEVLNVFSKEDILLDKMLDYLVDENIKREKLYFTPKETDSYLIKPIEGEGTLFALGEDTLLLANNQFMFPKLSHT
ncbi:hypothetical protein [Clostridium estertheticum]|uniref:hypothetical protein n=1 Tax=Clostridium estertheticum TaxID=238834 RepID=UPI001CF1FE17|nr:hypothetical protein [Clostridium estertheticum]MCB2354199.1 hypothetical protein [Clostridium estertheticum]WAG43327.1 hypothetical protein LL065_11855 [Clostridium estertheticum]